MAEVDICDDTINRYVVVHFKYSREQHGYRNFPVKAFDNNLECANFVNNMKSEIALLNSKDASPKERIFVREQPPGFIRWQKRSRLWIRMLKHNIYTYNYFYTWEVDGEYNPYPLIEYEEPPLRHVVKKYLDSII